MEAQERELFGGLFTCITKDLGKARCLEGDP